MDARKGSTTPWVVDDLLHNTLDVAVTLGVVQRAQLQGTLPVLGVALMRVNNQSIMSVMLCLLCLSALQKCWLAGWLVCYCVTLNTAPLAPLRWAVRRRKETTHKHSVRHNDDAITHVHAKGSLAKGNQTEHTHPTTHPQHYIPRITRPMVALVVWYVKKQAPPVAVWIVL